jgi:RES domain-containing protein
MRLWRLCSARRVGDFNGGYGLLHDGRWNTKGRPVTYCATVPSLTALEKRVHVTDAGLLPPQVMVAYDLPDDVPVRSISMGELPPDWATRETYTQRLGDAWLDNRTEAILLVPSVIVPIPDASDRNALINHRHAATARVAIAATISFTLDPRLFLT